MNFTLLVLPPQGSVVGERLSGCGPTLLLGLESCALGGTAFVAPFPFCAVGTWDEPTCPPFSCVCQQHARQGMTNVRVLA